MHYNNTLKERHYVARRDHTLILFCFVLINIKAKKRNLKREEKQRKIIKEGEEEEA